MSNVFQLYQLGDDFIEITDRSARTWRLSPLSLNSRSKVQSLFRNHCPDPMKLCEEACRNASPQAAAEMFKVAIRQRTFWPPKIESEEAIWIILENPPIYREFIFETLRRHQPDVTREDAEKLAEEFNAVSFSNVFKFAMSGVRPDDPNLWALPAAPGSPGSN